MRLAPLALLLPAALPLPSVAGETPIRLSVCSDYNCDRLRPVRLDTDQWRAIQALFAPVTTARQERAAIADAIGLLERYSGEQTGTSADRAGNDGDPADPGQLDCVAESLNSTRYLRLLADHRLLRWHRVGQRRYRHPWLFDYHWTAVIEASTGEQFAVDSWYRENGRPAVIQPLPAWLDARLPADL